MKNTLIEFTDHFNSGTVFRVKESIGNYLVLEVIDPRVRGKSVKWFKAIVEVKEWTHSSE